MRHSASGYGSLVLISLFAFGCSSSGGDAPPVATSELGKLPAPAGAKSQYADANVAMFVSEAPVEATAAECKKLLLAAGWQPYGSAGDAQFFKRDLTRLTAMIGSAPAQGGKTMIQYSQSQMPVDLPPPADSTHLHFADSIKRLDFDVKQTPAELFESYRAILAKAGWVPTTEKPIGDGAKQFQIFRNPQKDMLTLELRDLTDLRRGHLEHMSAAEVEEMDRKFKEEQAKQAAEKKTPLPKLKISLPAETATVPKDATISFEKSGVEFKIAAGSGRTWIDHWRKSFPDKSWKEEVLMLEPALGSITYSKEGQAITVTYIDPGLIPAEINIDASNVELEWVEKK